MAQQPFLGQGLLIIEASYSHFVTLTTVGSTLLDEWSARRTDIHLTNDNTHDKTYTSPAGFEPAVPTSQRPQTHASDRAARKDVKSSQLLYNITKLLFHLQF